MKTLPVISLELLVDTHSVEGVLSALATVCHEKADHIEENWQDARLAHAWAAMGNRIGAIADTAHTSGTPGITRQS